MCSPSSGWMAKPRKKPAWNRQQTAYSSTLQMDATLSSETTQDYVPEDITLQLSFFLLELISFTVFIRLQKLLKDSRISDAETVTEATRQNCNAIRTFTSFSSRISSGCHSNALPNVNKLHERKLCSRSRTSVAYFVSVYRVISVSIDNVVMLVWAV
jgi:hypothetical protein